MVPLRIVKRMEFDRNKFKSLVHYVIARAGNRDGFGATKLYKVLWFAETRQYLLTGKPITGATYIREKYGPVPQLGMQIRNELHDEGAIRQWQDRGYDFAGWRLQSLREPRLLGFTEEEVKTVNEWIEIIDKEHTAGSASDLSHDYAWEIAQMREPMPLFAQLATRMREPTPEELERAKKVAADLKLP
jgi:hypothetical protein